MGFDKDDWARSILAVIVISGFFTFIWKLSFGESRLEAAMMGTLVGYAAANATAVVQFYFGSSSGSAKKSQQLAEERAATSIVSQTTTVKPAAELPKVEQ